jgi:branched-chain amino acid transport system permease protein
MPATLDRARHPGTRRSVPLLPFALIAAVALPFLANAYTLGFATTILITAVGVVGFNVLTGWTGLVSLGYAGFFAVGAYTQGVLATRYGWPLGATLPAAAVVAALVSVLVGAPSLRLRGLYLAITTLAFSAIISHVILLAKPLTGGSRGLSVARPSVLGVPLKSDAAIFWLCAAGLLLAVWLAPNIRRSYLGRAFFAVRDAETAARVLGVDVIRAKLLAFALSSAITGFAGALFALHQRYLNVESFELLLSIEAVSILIVGGIGSIPGVIAGTVFMVLLPEMARLAFNAIGGPLAEMGGAQEIRGVIYGLVIILFLRFAPGGLIAFWTSVLARLRRWPHSG